MWITDKSAALGHCKCAERDEAVAYGAYHLDDLVQETKKPFKKALRREPHDPDDA
jgi:hypothetical protein